MNKFFQLNQIIQYKEREKIAITGLNLARNLLCCLLLFSHAQIGLTQHDSTHVHKVDTTKTPVVHSDMNSFYSINLPMNRDGSGTGWQADESPLWMYMKTKGKTTFMMHGSIFLRYTYQDLAKKSNKGGQQLDAPNMFMFALSKKLTQKDVFSAFAMISLEPLTVGNDGYPLLFQSGETYNGIPLSDRQHPHDLISALSINWTHSFSKNIDLNYYLGFPGEPALGPEVFMHRISAMNNPDAPLGHHWQDATHITFGVATLGFRYKIMKVEGSFFNGREPDEKRYNFDTPQADSYSYRISINPLRSLSFQFSQGFLQSPEVLSPTENSIRTTSSLIHTKQLTEKKFISSTLVWGMNSSNTQNLNSFLLESNLQLNHFAIYSRYEILQKDAHDLNIIHANEDQLFLIQAFTLGINKALVQSSWGNISIGLQSTVNFPDSYLKTIYGDLPVSAQVYLRFFPPLMLH